MYLICLVREKIRSEYQIIWVLEGCALAHSQFGVFYVNITPASKISAVQQWNSSCSTWKAGDHAVRESQDICNWKWPLVSSQPHCSKQDQLRAVFSGPFKATVCTSTGMDTSFSPLRVFLINVSMLMKRWGFLSPVANKCLGCCSLCSLPFIPLLCSSEKQKLRWCYTLLVGSCSPL